MNRTVALLFPIAAIISCVASALPPELDPGAKLDAARETYERAVEDIRVQIDKTFVVKEDALRAKPGKDDAIDKMVEQHKAFTATGDVPATLGVRAQLAAYQNQRAALIAAYTAAAEGYKHPKVKLDDLRKQMRREVTLLTSEDDLCPWGPNLTSKLPGADRTLDSKNSTWTMEGESTVPYRVEISGQADTGALLMIELPVKDDRRIGLPVRTSAGSFHAIVTVREEGVAVDLGIDRQAEIADADRGTQIQLRVASGKCTLENVRVKPVRNRLTVAGDPKDAEAKRTDGLAEGDIDVKQQFPVKSTWRGVYEQVPDGVAKHSVTATVLAADENSVQMEVRISGHATRIYHLKMEGPVILLLQNEGVGKIPGSDIPANRIENTEMSVTLEGKKLTFKGSQITIGASGGLVGKFRSTLILTRK